MKLKPELIEELRATKEAPIPIGTRASLMRLALDRHRETRLRAHVEGAEIVFYELKRVEVLASR